MKNEIQSMKSQNEQLKAQVQKLENEKKILMNLIQFKYSQEEIETLKNDEDFKKNHQSLYVKWFEGENETNTPVYKLNNNVKNEIQSNIITEAIYNCTPTERKIIAYSIAQVNNQKVIKYDKERNEHNEIDVNKIDAISMGIIKFKISDFLKTMEIETRNYSVIQKAIDNITNCKIRLETNESLINCTWFNYSVYNKFEKCCYVKFNDIMFMYLLNQKSNFTRLKLKIIGKAKSIYTIRFYELGTVNKGFKGKRGNEISKWFFEMTPEEIKEKFAIEESKFKDRIDNFFKIVIEEPLNELNSINDEFKVSVKKCLVGRKTNKYRFECTEIKPTRAKTLEEKALMILENSKGCSQLNEKQKNSKAEKDFLLEYFNSHQEEIELLKKTTPKGCFEHDLIYNLRLADILAKIKNEKPSFD